MFVTITKDVMARIDVYLALKHLLFIIASFLSHTVKEWKHIFVIGVVLLK